MQLFANNIETVLSVAAAAGDLTLTVADAGEMPSPTGADYLLATLSKHTGDVEHSREIVKVTGLSGNVLTVARGQEGTAAQSYEIGDHLGLRLTAGGLSGLQAQLTNLQALAASSDGWFV